MTDVPRNGSVISYQLDLYQAETLTSEASLTSSQEICADSASVISLPGLAGGLTHSGLPDGQKIEKSGLDHVPVSRFRALGSGKAMPTNDISGPLFTASSPSADLQLSLESRLRARMGENGSLEYALIWKQQDMPAGVPICALRASARRTFGKDCSGWASPSFTDEKDRKAAQHRKHSPRLGMQVNLYCATTEQKGVSQLNPRFSLWLMGYPEEWASCGEAAMQLCRKSRRSL